MKLKFQDFVLSVILAAVVLPTVAAASYYGWPKTWDFSALSIAGDAVESGADLRGYVDTENTALTGYVDSENAAQDTVIGTKLATASYTASDVLTKMKTVDGTGSGLDADLMRGRSGSVLWGSDNDGNGSGLDADLMRGRQVYRGAVNSDGTCEAVHSGWSCVRSAAGLYQITHNLASVVYGECNTFGFDGSTSTQICVGSASAGNQNSFVVSTKSSAGTSTDSAFTFEIWK